MGNYRLWEIRDCFVSWGNNKVRLIWGWGNGLGRLQWGSLVLKRMISKQQEMKK